MSLEAGGVLEETPPETLESQRNSTPSQPRTARARTPAGGPRRRAGRTGPLRVQIAVESDERKGGKESDRPAAGQVGCCYHKLTQARGGGAPSSSVDVRRVRAGERAAAGDGGKGEEGEEGEEEASFGFPMSGQRFLRPLRT
jgi:hypothetical protein